MSFFKKLTEDSKRELIALKATKTITKEDLIHPEWKFLNSEYEANQNSDWETKALVSLTNSMFHQKRAYFVLARSAFRELCKSDKNWKKPIGLKNENWKGFILTATKANLIKKTHTSSKGYLVFELCNQDLLKMLTIDLARQRAEAIEFSEKHCENEDLDKGDSQGDTSGDKQGDREEEREREAELEEPVGEDSLSKEEITPAPVHLQNVTPQPTPTQPKMDLNSILYGWKNGLQELNVKTRLEDLTSLFQLMKDNGYTHSDLSNSVKKTITAFYVSDNPPKGVNKAKWQMRLDLTKRDIEEAACKTFIAPITCLTNSSVRIDKSDQCLSDEEYFDQVFSSMKKSFN